MKKFTEVIRKSYHTEGDKAFARLSIDDMTVKIEGDKMVVGDLISLIENQAERVFSE